VRKPILARSLRRAHAVGLANPIPTWAMLRILGSHVHKFVYKVRRLSLVSSIFRFGRAKRQPSAPAGRGAPPSRQVGAEQEHLMERFSSLARPRADIRSGFATPNRRRRAFNSVPYRASNVSEIWHIIAQNLVNILLYRRFARFSPNPSLTLPLVPSPWLNARPASPCDTVYGGKI
jgi:hypothetical protein